MPLQSYEPEQDADEIKGVPYAAPRIDPTDFPSLPAKEKVPPEAGWSASTALPVGEMEKPGWGVTTSHALFGVILPIVTLAVEISTGMCAEEFFDPIPTLGHILLLAVIPVVNLLTLIALHDRIVGWLASLRFANGFALGVAIFYTLLFLPITPIAIIGLLFIIGILPLSPALSCLSTMMLRRRLRAACEDVGVGTRGVAKLGIALGLGLLLVAEVPSVITECGLRLAASENIAQQSSGLAILRTIGSNDALLRSCYARRRSFDITGMVASMLSLRSASIEEARTIYYRVNGTAFNAVPPPALSVRSMRSEAFDVDMDLGEESVGSFVRGLSLDRSRIDASIDTEAALSYTEWTMTFDNRSDVAREARMLVALPPGGAISRLTLWVNGVEEEAAFGSREATRTAYEGVVRQSRDPVLVSSAGVDRVLIQCFPVPADMDGEMKIRFGITAPLVPNAPDGANYIPPTLLERNFRLPEKGSDLWVESKGKINRAPDGLFAESTGNGRWRARGQTGNSEGVVPARAITVASPSRAVPLWTEDRFDSTKIIQQRIVQQTTRAPRRLALVVDGSESMEDALPMVASALRALPLPEGIDISVIVASEQTRELVAGTATPELYEEAASELNDFDAYGGNDNLPALNKAWDFASGGPDGVVIWIHGAQPVELESTYGLLQRFQRSENGPELYELQFGGGRNRILEQLDGIDKVHGLEKGGQLQEGLWRAFAMFRPDTASWTIERKQLSRSEIGNAAAGMRGSDHIARLWAKEEVASNVLADREHATRLAIAYQLVTPVTGAVVLEAAEQYAEAGLSQVSPGSVPSVPEPETWAMIIISMILVGWTVLRALTGGASA